MKHLLFFLSSTLLASELITNPDDVRLQALIKPSAQAVEITEQELLERDVRTRMQQAPTPACQGESRESFSQVLADATLQQAIKTKNYKAMLAGVTYATIQSRLATLKELAQAEKATEVVEYIDKWNPIHLATAFNMVDVLQDVPKDKVDIFDRDEFTPLYTAICVKAHESTSMLIARGADVNKRNYKGHTALLCAVGENDKEGVSLLLQAGAKTDMKFMHLGSIYDYDALWFAVEKKHTECVRLLVDAGANVHSTFMGISALAQATRNGYVDGMAILLTKKCHQKDLDSSLHIACQSGFDVGVRLLLKEGANKDVEMECPCYGSIPQTPLFTSIMDNNPSCVKALVEAGANVNKTCIYCRDSISPLWQAASLGYADCVAILLAAGANTQFISQERTPLQIASERKNERCIRLLLDAQEVGVQHNSKACTLL